MRLLGRSSALVSASAAATALTCQVQVDEALSEGGDGGGEGVDRLVRDAPTLAQVQPAQVRHEPHQQAGRRVRQIQTSQSQLRHVVEASGSALAVSRCTNQTARVSEVSGVNGATTGPARPTHLSWCQGAAPAAPSGGSL